MKAVDMKTHGDVIRAYSNEKLADMVVTYIINFSETVFVHHFEPEAVELIRRKVLRDLDINLDGVSDASK